MLLPREKETGMKSNQARGRRGPVVTRRRFIRGSVSTGLTTLLATRLSSRAYAGSSDRIRVGLVGCGGRGIYAGISDCVRSSPFQGSGGRATFDFGHAKIGETTSPSSMRARGCNRLSSSMPI